MEEFRRHHALRAHIAAILQEDWHIVSRDPLTLCRGSVRWIVRHRALVREQ